MTGKGRIDVHHHLVPREYRRWLRERGETAGGRGIPGWSVAAAVNAMDADEIATAVLSVSAPGVDLDGVDAEQARARARAVNEDAATLRHERPERFGFFATLPLPDVDGALEEIRYAFDELAADGVVLLTSARGRYLGDARLRPVFAELDRRRAVVLVHPREPAGEPVAGLPPYAVDFLLETTRSAVSMARGGVLELRHLKIVLCHGGGFLPYAAFRASLFSSGAPVIALPPGMDWSPPGIDRLRRFYLETALTASPTALPSLLAFAAPGHLLFGSDFPFAPAPVGHAVTRMLDAYEMPDAVRRSIDRDAAEALFPRLARPGSTTGASAGTGSSTARGRSLRWWAGRSTRVRRPER